MEAISHVGLVLGNGSQLRSASAGLWFTLKFQLDRIDSLGDSVIFIFSHFGLKLPIHTQF